MLMPRPSDDSLLECPAGYQYYSCAASRFVGCCSIEPCDLLGVCPIQNQPGFQTLPDTMTCIISSAVPDSTPPSKTMIPEPVIATTSGASYSNQSPPYPTSSALDASAHPKVNHAGLIAGLVVGLSAVLVATAVLLYKLWRHRQIMKVGDDVPSTLRGNLRTKAASRPATPGLSDRNKPVPPVPTPITEAQFLGRDGDNDGRGPTDPNTPASTAGAATLRQPSIRAVPFSPSRTGTASVPSRDDEGEGGGTGAASTPSRGPSPEDSLFFGSSPGWRGSDLRSPSEFHGLSAPPRSRDGSRPGSKGNQAG